jgi:hypothetical protein
MERVRCGSLVWMLSFNRLLLLFFFPVCFSYQNQYFELDQFVSPHKGLYLMEFYAESGKDVTNLLPPFFKVSAWEMDARGSEMHRPQLLIETFLTLCANLHRC